MNPNLTIEQIEIADIIYEQLDDATCYNCRNGNCESHCCKYINWQISETECERLAILIYDKLRLLNE